MKYLQSLSFYTKPTTLFIPIIFCSVLLALIHYKLFLSYEQDSSLIDPQNQLSSSATILPISTDPNFLQLEVMSGDTFLNLLFNANVAKTDALNAVNALSTYYNLAALHIGQKISLTFDADATPSDDTSDASRPLQSLTIKINPEKELHLLRTANGTFSANEVLIPLTKRLTKLSATIDYSLLATSSNLGISPNLMMDLIKAYSYDIDFQRDIQSGDKFEVMFERFYTPDGELAREGDVLFSSLTTGNKKLTIYHYTPKNGKAEYFTADGRNVRKDLLRTPLNIAHISSRFGMRKHPVLGYSKMHKGVDFAASTGTPILAAGSGVVAEIGRKGSYGNYIRIQHTKQYSTAYAHISRFSKLKKGDTVTQGDVIAYVGSTGRATGPHLHYEVLANNHQVDPLSMKMSPGLKLSGAEWNRFTEQKKKVDTLFAQIPAQTEIALATQ